MIFVWRTSSVLDFSPRAITAYDSYGKTLGIQRAYPGGGEDFDCF